MDSRYMNLAEMYHESSLKNYNSAHLVNPANTVGKTCMNDDFCTPTPRDMNNGILTMAFVDMQPLESVYSLEDSFCNGTLFPNINKPFRGGMVR